MGMRGPSPKATNLKILEGNPGKRPLNLNEPQPDVGAVCPDWLSESASLEWKRLAPILENCNILTVADADTLAAYCDSLVNYKRITKKIETAPLIEETNRGTRVNPLLAAQKNYADLMIKFGTKLGLSPSDRSSIKISDNPQKSFWGEAIS